MHLGPKVMKETRVSVSTVKVRSGCWSCYDSRWTRSGRGQARTEKGLELPAVLEDKAMRVRVVVARLHTEQAEECPGGT